MWTEPGQVTYQGKHYRVTGAYCEPKPDPVPPILVGGGGATTMLLAAKYAQIWNLSDSNIDRYTQHLAKLREQCEKAGRDPASLRLSWYGRVAVGRNEAEALRRGYGKFTHENAFVGTPEHIVEQMNEFVDVGCDFLMLEPLGIPDPEVLAMLSQEILPRVKG